MIICRGYNFSGFDKLNFTMKNVLFWVLSVLGLISTAALAMVIINICINSRF